MFFFIIDVSTVFLNNSIDGQNKKRFKNQYLRKNNIIPQKHLTFHGHLAEFNPCFCQSNLFR